MTPYPWLVGRWGRDRHGDRFALRWVTHDEDPGGWERVEREGGIAWVGPPVAEDDPREGDLGGAWVSAVRRVFVQDPGFAIPVLARAAAKDPSPADEDALVGQLRDLVWPLLEELIDEPDPRVWDARAAELAQRLGPAGRELAAAIRQRSAQRRDEGGDPWDGWLRPMPKSAFPSPTLLRLAALLASGVVAGADANRRQPAALVEPLARRVGQLRRGAIEDGELIFVGTAHRPLELRGSAPSELAGLDVLGKLAVLRLVRFIAEQAAELRSRLSVDNRIAIDGGWSELARRVGCGSKKGADEVEEAVRVLHHTYLSWDGPGGRGSHVLVPWFHVAPATTGRPARVEFGFSDLFSPGYVRSITERSERFLIPVLPEPSLEGLNPTLHAPAVRLDLLAVRALAAAGAEVVERGGTAVEWSSLAREAGFPPGAVGPLLRGWGDRWVEVEPGVWNLAPGPARDFIEAGGRMRQAGRSGGRKSAARRWRRA